MLFDGKDIRSNTPLGEGIWNDHSNFTWNFDNTGKW